MSKIVVLGGGVCGLAAGMMLARDGHEVCLFERDPAPVPETVNEAWEYWSRRLPQLRQPHILQARVRRILQAELPDVLRKLEDAGGLKLNPLDLMPESVSDTAADEDEHLVTITARRATTEYVFARAAENEPGLKIHRGTAATGVVVRNGSGRPHVHGVSTTTETEIHADLVVDAMGRTSPMPAWLRKAGGPPIHEETESGGLAYYTRFFRARGGYVPQPAGTGLSTALGSISISTLPADQGVWSVSLAVSPHDRPLKQLKDSHRWEAVVSACPQHAHWLDGEAITGVLPFSTVLDRYRRPWWEGEPVSTGIAMLADSWACTNPLLGRGVALGLLHTVCLRDTVRAHLGDPVSFARAWDAVTEDVLTPWYRTTAEMDRARVAEIDAIRDGRVCTPSAHDDTNLAARFSAAIHTDAQVFRSFTEIMGCLALPSEVFQRTDIVRRVMNSDIRDVPPPTTGPSRAELLRILE